MFWDFPKPVAVSGALVDLGIVALHPLPRIRTGFAGTAPGEK